jgi:hypothetical protein
MFLGNNGVETFASSRFRRISEQCCSTILFPPMEWSFPVFNVHKIIGQRIRNYVANGNIFVLTGGIPAIEFINAYFFYVMELADGNYSPGPFRRLDKVPPQMRDTPKILPQKGISVTAVKKESLPSGATVLWGTPRTTPVFMIKFCEAQSPDEGMPPVKVLPRDCPMAAQQGRPCSCGHIIYIGYTFGDPYPSRWDKILLASVEILNPSWGCDSAALSSKPCPALAAPAAPALPAPAAPAPAPAPAKAAAKKKEAGGSGAALSAVAEEDRVAAALVSALSTLEKRAAAPAEPQAEARGPGQHQVAHAGADARGARHGGPAARTARGARPRSGGGMQAARAHMAAYAPVAAAAVTAGGFRCGQGRVHGSRAQCGRGGSKESGVGRRRGEGRAQASDACTRREVGQGVLRWGLPCEWVGQVGWRKRGRGGRVT